MSETRKKQASRWQKVTLTFWLGLLFLISAGQDQPATEDCTCTDESGEEDKDGYRLQISLNPTNAELPLNGSKTFEIRVYKVKGGEKTEIKNAELTVVRAGEFIRNARLGRTSIECLDKAAPCAVVFIKHFDELTRSQLENARNLNYLLWAKRATPSEIITDFQGLVENGWPEFLLFNANENFIHVIAKEPGTDRQAKDRVIITVKDRAIGLPKPASSPGDSP